MLLKVSGIGPKLAMSIMSAVPTDELKLAVVTGDVKTLSRAPGLGKKTAEKLILELKDSFDAAEVITGGRAPQSAPLVLDDAFSEAAQALMDATREALFEGIGQAVAGNRIGDIGHAVQSYAEARSYSVVRDFVGHGVGAKLHEEPSVPNYGTPGRGVKLLPGMVIAIEPMINQGSKKVRVLQDKWTTVTADGLLSAHFEHTIAITSKGPVILTLPD